MKKTYNVWDAVYTNKQEKAVIDETVKQMEQLLLRKDYQDIRDDIFIPIGNKSEGEVAAITPKGFVYAHDRMTGSIIEKDDWQKVIKMYRISPKTVQSVALQIALSLV